MGSKRHLKRLPAPSFWPILRKEKVWTVKPCPGPHPVSRSLPLLIVVRDLLKLADTNREARKVIVEGHVKVDGVVRKNYKYPVGFMDVIEVVATGDHFRMVPIPVKVMGLVKISSEEALFKLSRIENKTTVKGGHIQLNLYDGRNILIKVSDPRSPEEDLYTTMGTVKLKISTGEMLDYYPLKEGAPAMVLGGRNVGKVAKIISIGRGMRHYRKLITLEDFNGNKFYTTLDKIMVIGKEKPEISLPGGIL